MGVIFVADILDILLSGEDKPQKREDRFYLVGEDDGQGCIVLRKHYLYNPKRKSRAIKIPVTEFWGTAESFVGGAYKAQYLPEDKRPDPKESLKKLRRLQKYLKAANEKIRNSNKKKPCKKAAKKVISKKSVNKKHAKKI